MYALWHTLPDQMHSIMIAESSFWAGAYRSTLLGVLALLLARVWLSGYGQSYPVDTAWVTGCIFECRVTSGAHLPDWVASGTHPPRCSFPGSPPAHTQLDVHFLGCLRRTPNLMLVSWVTSGSHPTPFSFYHANPILNTASRACAAYPTAQALCVLCEMLSPHFLNKRLY